MGVVKKSAGKLGFQWDLEKWYSVALVGQAAQGVESRLSQFDSDDDATEITSEAGGKKRLELANGRQISVDFPSDLTETEFDYFTSWFKMVVFPKVC